jgi:DnaJ family protein C protein 2
MNSSREEVERFYNFWSTFDSWRTFELLDEEDPEQAENRDERRWIEKQNRAKRIKKKKDEAARILKLVDTAISLDPRVQKFREDDKAAKDAKKRARREALRRAEEEARLAEEQVNIGNSSHRTFIVSFNTNFTFFAYFTFT